MVTEPVTLSAGQILELNERFATLRHDVNNHLSLMMAAVELIRRRPDNADRMWDTLTSQPQKVVEALAQFSSELEITLHGIKP